MNVKQKNVIVLHTDQQRADSLGCMGNRFARTPNIDRLASEGCLCTRHIASNPICMPSRASLLTGLYPPGHNVWCNGVPLNRKGYTEVDARHQSSLQGKYVPEPETLADIFGHAGYDTAAFGKLHLTPYLGPESYGHQENCALSRREEFADWHGPYYGFRYVDLVIGHGEQQPAMEGHYAAWLKKNYPDLHHEVTSVSPKRTMECLNDLHPCRIPSDLHNSAWLADRLCNYIGSERPKDKPFCAFVGFPDPHHPFAPCFDTLKEFEDIEVHEPLDPEGAGVSGPFHGLFKSLSQHTVEKMSREDLRTVIRYTYAMVYQIDRAVGRILDTLEKQGIAEETIVVFTSDHGDYLGDHGHLRKGLAASNSLLNVPFVIRAPGSGLPSRIDAPVSNCDVVPTLSSLCGVSAPEWCHGVDFTSLPDDHCAFAFSSNGSPESVNYTAYDRRYRMTWYPFSGHTELFDHNNDPGESRNIAGDSANSGRMEGFRNRICQKHAEFANPILGRVCAW